MLAWLSDFTIDATHIRGKCSDAEDEIELCMAAVVDDRLGRVDVLLIKLEERRAMQDREERCPFLEEDPDHLVRFESWGRFPRDLPCKIITFVYVDASSQETICVDV